MAIQTENLSLKEEWPQESKPVPHETLKHAIFETVLAAVQAAPVYMVGPAGAGKTHLGSQLAEALNVLFYFTGAVDSEYKIRGFRDAYGNVAKTEFRQAFGEGGVFLFDEVDASNPQALLAVNTAIANGFFDAPDGRVNKHKDFYCIASANTYGHGADRQYIGRNELDGASLDRFLYIPMDYDPALERKLTPEGFLWWTDIVHCLRNAARELDIRHIISTRAVIAGAKLLQIGKFGTGQVLDMAVWKGLERGEVEKIIHEALPDMKETVQKDGWTWRTIGGEPALFSDSADGKKGRFVSLPGLNI